MSWKCKLGWHKWIYQFKDDCSLSHEICKVCLKKQEISGFGLLALNGLDREIKELRDGNQKLTAKFYGIDWYIGNCWFKFMKILHTKKKKIFKEIVNIKYQMDYEALDNQTIICSSDTLKELKKILPKNAQSDGFIMGLRVETDNEMYYDTIIIRGGEPTKFFKIMHIEKI